VTDSLPLVKGTLDTLVLKALTWEPMHGFEITRWLEQGSRGRIGVEDSALYQALYRMEERRLITAEWGVTHNNRKARYYRTTPTGRAHLKAQTAEWLRYAETVSAILTTPARAR
jgi:transcriptional regulator